MRSTEVYTTIRHAVDPWCRENGFTRAKSGWLAYQKAVGGQFLSFWFQCDKHGWDAYCGSRFTVEFQLHESPDLGRLDNLRLAQYLTPEELEFARQLQNSIIAKIPPPPQAWVDSFESHVRRLYKEADLMMEGFWEPWRQIPGPLRAQDDLWLRYWDEGDVKTWAALILNVLPRIVAQIVEVQSVEPSM
jgi:hypothetical protein